MPRSWPQPVSGAPRLEDEMAKVWALFSGSYEDRDIVGIYSTLERAQAVPHGHDPVWSTDRDGVWFCDWHLVHVRVAEPGGIEFTTIKVPVVDGIATLPNGRTVQSDAHWVVVPIAPQFNRLSIINEWSDGCDMGIVEYELD